MHSYIYENHKAGSAVMYRSHEILGMRCFENMSHKLTVGQKISLHFKCGNLHPYPENGNCSVFERLEHL
jgi:hypothetical protein